YWFTPSHYIWDSGGVDNAASTRFNWDQNIAPSTDRYVTIDDYADAITWDIATTLAELTVNGSFSGSITQTVDLYSTGLINLQLQTWDMNGQELSASDLVIGNAATIDTSTNDLTIGQSLSMTNLSTISGTGTVFFYANDADNTISGGTITDDVIITTDGTTTWTLENNLTIVGDLTIKSGATFDLDAYDLSVSGIVTIEGTMDASSSSELWFGDDVNSSSGTYTAGSETMYFYSANAATITIDEAVNAVIVQKGAGTATLANALSAAGAMTITSGTLDIDTYDLTVAGVVDVDGTLDAGSAGQVWFGDDVNTAGGTYTVGTETIYLYSAQAATITIDETINDITVQKGGGNTATLANTLNASGAMTITSGTLDLDTYNLTVTGAAVINGTLDASSSTEVWFGSDLSSASGTYTGGTETVHFYNAGALSIAIGGTLGSIEIDKGANTTTLGASLATNGAVTLNAGAIDVGAYDLTVGGNFVVNGTVDGSDAACDIYVGGDWDMTSCVFTYGSGRVWFYGSSDSTVTMAGQEFGDLYISKDALDDNVTISDFLVMNSDLLIQGGNFFINSELTLNGNMTVSSGARFTSLGAGETMFFNDSDLVGYWINAGATIVLHGTNGNELNLRSDSDGNQWDFYLFGTRTMTYISVKDGDATGGNIVNPTNSIDVDNNDNWFSYHFTWTGLEGDLLATSGNNWDYLQPPTEGAAVSIYDTNDQIDWDLLINLGELTLSGAFVGEVTQSVNLSVSDRMVVDVQEWHIDTKDLEVMNLVVTDGGRLDADTGTLTISQSLILSQAAQLGYGDNPIFFAGADADNTISGATLYDDAIFATAGATTWTLESDLTIDGDLTIQSGATLALGGYELTVTGSIWVEGTLDTSAANSVAFIANDWDSTGGSVTAGSGIVYFYGSNESLIATGGTELGAITIGKATLADEVTTSDTLSMGGNLLIESGRFWVANNLTMNSNMTISSGASFTCTTASTEIFFNDDDTVGYWVNAGGSIELTGSSGNEIILRSDSEGNQWDFFLAQETGRSMRYLDVQDSDASGGVFVRPRNSINSGNTINWFATHYVWVSNGPDEKATTDLNWDSVQVPSHTHYVSIYSTNDSIDWDVSVTLAEL
ncbi:beta strand repeat-containing protein, partial [Candidatus Omnitrophota bacterium]